MDIRAANASTALTFTASSRDTGNIASETRQEHVVTGIAHFDRLATRGRAILDASPESQPALGLMLGLAEHQVPYRDVMALNDTLIERFAQGFDVDPAVARGIVSQLPGALRQRTESQSVEDVCDELLDPASYPALKRLLDQFPDVPHETSRYGSSWSDYFCEWRDWVMQKGREFLLLGSGAESSGASFDVSDTDSLPPAPKLDFTRHGMTGYVMGMLYASSICQSSLPHTPPQLPRSPEAAPGDSADTSRPTVDLHGRSAVAGTTNLPNVGDAGGAPDASNTPILDRLENTAADARRLVENAITGFPENMGAMLDRWLSFPPLVLPGAAAAYLPAVPPIVIARGMRVTSGAPPSALPDMSASPEMQRLIDTAGFWRHRAAVHRDLEHRFAPLLTFTLPPSEKALLDALLVDVEELKGHTLTDVKLRRHAPIEGENRRKRVTFWSLPTGARHIRSGALNITHPDEGVSFDLSLDTPEGANYESPSLMSAQRFNAIVSQWGVACDERAAQTWQPPASLKKMAATRLTRETHNSLALGDLSLAYTSGLISNQAFYLAHSALANLSLSHDPADAWFRTDRLEFKIRLDDQEHVVTPAGTCVVGAASGNGTTLLYLQGDSAAWRAFPNPKALIDDIVGDKLSLRTTLCERLPLHLGGCAKSGALTALERLVDAVNKRTARETVEDVCIRVLDLPSNALRLKAADSKADTTGILERLRDSVLAEHLVGAANVVMAGVDMVGGAMRAFRWAGSGHDPRADGLPIRAQARRLEREIRRQAAHAE